MRLSIVATLFQSERCVEEFCARATAAAAGLTNDFEIVLVNDGSPDRSLDLARSVLERNWRVKVIDLSRNFGHHRAMMTGLASARGDLVFLIDSDLEVAPELLADFDRTLAAHDADAVYGVQKERPDSFQHRIAATASYALINWLSAERVPPHLVTARLMTRRFVQALVSHEETEVVLAGLCVLSGFKQIPLPVVKTYKGFSSYTGRRRAANLVDAITSFSDRPLLYIFYMGVLLSVTAFAAAFYLVARRVLFGDLLMDWPSLIASIWFFGGLIVLSIGVVGIYVSKVFRETKRRPRSIVRQVYEHDDGPDAARVS